MLLTAAGDASRCFLSIAIVIAIARHLCLVLRVLNPWQSFTRLFSRSLVVCIGTSKARRPDNLHEFKGIFPVNNYNHRRPLSITIMDITADCSFVRNCMAVDEGEKTTIGMYQSYHCNGVIFDQKPIEPIIKIRFPLSNTRNRSIILHHPSAAAYLAINRGDTSPQTHIDVNTVNGSLIAACIVTCVGEL